MGPVSEIVGEAGEPGCMCSRPLKPCGSVPMLDRDHGVPRGNEGTRRVSDASMLLGVSGTVGGGGGTALAIVSQGDSTLGSGPGVRLTGARPPSHLAGLLG